MNQPDDRPFTGPYTHKLYKCRRCGAERTFGTNHWGEIYPQRCSGCPPFRWSETVYDCLEPCPETHRLPKPWKFNTIAQITKNAAKEPKP